MEEPTFQLISRVSEYTPVSLLINYYYMGRSASPVIAFAESTLEEGYRRIAEPILNYTKPILTTVDSFGCKALDKVEEGSTLIKNKYENTAEIIGTQVNLIKETTFDAMQTMNQKIVTPVDIYLRDSTLAKPFILSLNMTEKVVDKILPEEEEDPLKESRGPITKSAYLTWRIPHEVLARLHYIGHNPPSHPDPMVQTIQLIDFASNSLDNAVQTIDKIVTKGVNTMKKGTDMVMNVPRKATKMSINASYEALAAIHGAIHTISNQIPEEITFGFNQLTETAFTSRGEELPIFPSVASSSSKVLREMSATIGGYISRGEKIPKQILTNVYSNLQNVRDSLLVFVRWRKGKDCVIQEDISEGDESNEDSEN